MNITLSADAKLIKKGREYAKKHNTSLNQLVRDYLQKLGGNDAKDAANEFVHLATSMPGKSEPGFKVDREKIHDR